MNSESDSIRLQRPSIDPETRATDPKIGTQRDGNRFLLCWEIKLISRTPEKIRPRISF